MKRSTKRFWYILGSLLSMGIGLTILFVQFQDNIVFFYSPTQVKTQSLSNKLIRVGGLVSKNSVHYNQVKHQLCFTLTDGKESIQVLYQGLVPSLFREGQGMVAQGYFTSPYYFKANELLAKHDENYHPPTLDKLPQPNDFASTPIYPCH